MDDIRITERILERAGDRFFEEGFSGFTMDDIARENGMSKKTLYRLIPSKNDLILKVVGRQIDMVQQKQEAIIADPNLNYRQKLDAVVKAISRVLQRIQRKTMQELARLHPDLWELIRKRRMELLRNVTRILKEGQDNYEVRNDISVKFIAHYFQSVIDAMVTPSMVIEEDLSPSEILETAVNLFFDGVAITKDEKGLRRIEE